MTLALLIVGLVGGGLRTLVGDNPANERLLGILALLAGISALAVAAAYLHRPTRALAEPTFRTDPDDEVRDGVSPQQRVSAGRRRRPPA